MMITELDRALKKNGYQFVKVQPQEMGVYYKLVEGEVHVILGVHDHMDFFLNAVQFESIKSHIRELFLHPQGRIDGFPLDVLVYDVKLLALVLTTKVADYREVCSSSGGMWLVDTVYNRLVIYENQPGDFFGLNTLIQGILDKETNDGDTSSYHAANANRIRNKWKKQQILYRTNGRPRAIMNTALVVINILVFLVMTLFGDTNDGSYIAAHGAMYPEFVVVWHEWYRLFTCMFIHIGGFHLVNNMVMLFFTGYMLEDALGKVKYLILYIISGLGGSFVSLAVMMHTGDYAVSAGASGAIFGVVGGLLWVVIRNKGRFEQLNSKGLLIMIGLCLYYGFATAGVDNWCHMGGLITGFVMAMLLYRKNRVDNHI